MGYHFPCCPEEAAKGATPADESAFEALLQECISRSSTTWENSCATASVENITSAIVRLKDPWKTSGCSKHDIRDIL